MNSQITLIVLLVIAAIVVLMAWKKGYLEQIKRFVLQTRDELRKCSWPSRDELKGSTIVVMVSIALVGGFTVIADFVVRETIKLMM